MSSIPLATIHCGQWFVYEWDEVGQLAHAQRWDFPGSLPAALPTTPPEWDLRYAYAGGSRVVKTSKAEDGTERHSLEVFGSLRFERDTFDEVAGDYARTPARTHLYLGGGVGHAFADTGTLPAPVGSPAVRMFLTMGDHLGSATVTVDATTSEVVERATFQPFGAMESDYRPDRWGDNRELYKFTGKEEDIEVGATYFGARYYQPHLGRFMSADPLAVHGMGGDLNPYAYVRGRVMTHVDPLGLEDEAVAAAAAAGAGETPQPEANHPEGVYEQTSVQIIEDPCGGTACADAQVARSRTGFGFDPPSTRAPVGNLLGVPPDGARTDDVIGRGMKDTVTSRDWRGPEIQKTIAPMGQAGGAVLLAALYIVVLPEVLAAAEEAAVAAAAAAGVREAAEPEERVRSGLAAAIAAAADDEVIADVIALARDARHGSSRLLLLSALERSADPRARAALIELGADPDLTKEVHVILRRLTC